MRIGFVIIICFFVVTKLSAQDSIRKENLVKSIEYLASDQLAGRWPGSAGDSASRQYIIGQFVKAGIQPAFPGYVQAFQPTIKLEAPAKENYVKTSDGFQLSFNANYGIFPFSGSAKVNARIIVATNFETSLQALQKHKQAWVLVWRKKLNVPATDSLSDYALARKAEQQGAAGVIFVTPDSLDSKDVLVRLRPRKDAILSIPVLHIKRETAQKIVDALGMPSSVGMAAQPSFFVTKKTLNASIQIKPVTVNAVNIAGIIPGYDAELKNEYIVLGAHYDHLGLGGFGTGSLKPDTMAIHNGADDNASGTAALLEIARLLSKNKLLLKRSVIVVAFAAEEEGLLGSNYFVNHLPVPDSSIKVMLNMDMVGRLNSANQLYMGGAGTFPGGAEFMKGLEAGSGLNLVIHQGGVGGSDHVSFYQKGISCIGLHTGGHPQYHTPEDDAVLINGEGIEKVAKYIYRAVEGLCNRNEPWGFIRRDD